MSGAVGAMMFGAGGAQGVINGALPNGVGAGSAAFQLLNDGTYSITPSQTGNWVTPASASLAAQYEVKIDETIGTFTTGTVGSYVALSSTQTWTVTGVSVQFTVTFREAATQVVRSTQTGVTLDGT